MTPKEARKFNKQIKAFKIQGIIISMPSNRLKSLYEKQEAKIKWLEERYIQANETIKKLQNKLNTLKNDVARYFELFELQSNEVAFPTEYLFTDDDWRELYFLEEKLSKVGNEE